MTSDQMQVITTDVVAELVQLAWQTFVGSDLEAIADKATVDEVTCASISIGGPWSATVLLHCSPALARHCTATVLGMELDELEDADVHDIMGELANIIGGNLKGVVSAGDGDWSLSLPVVSNSLQSVPGSRLATQVTFLTDGHVLGCQVFEHA